MVAKMKKMKFGAGLIVYLVLCVGGMLAFGAYSGNKAVTVGERPTYDIYDEDAMTSNDQYGLASQQSIRAYADTLSGLTPVYISSTTPFSSHTGAGTSYYQTRGGFLYIFDQTAINTCAVQLGDKNGIASGGVTVFLPDPATDPGERVAIFVLTGGVTVLNVRGAPNEAEATSGATTSKFQNNSRYVSGTSLHGVASTLYTELNRVGEGAEWIVTYDQAGVSAIQVSHTID